MSFAKLVLTKDGFSLNCNQVDGQPFSGMFTKIASYPSSLFSISSCRGLAVDPFYGVQVHTNKTDSHFS